MFHNQILRRITTVHRLVLNPNRCSSSTNLDLEKLEAESAVAIEVIDDEIAKREEEIERKRNKSRLRPGDRNMVLEKRPYTEPTAYYQGTLKYNRKLFGRYGFESGVDPAICWPTKGELADIKEYEQIAYPKTIPEMVAIEKAKSREKKEQTLERQKQIVERIGKLDGWVKEMRDRVNKKEKEAHAAKAKRERLIEEVRAHFGYTVDPRDEKFKVMLEKKEKEQKKVEKEQKRKMKEQQLMDKLLKKPASKSTGEQANVEDDLEKER